jgi:alkane 1-monooxygenase
MNSARAPLSNPTAALGAALAVWFALLPAFCIALGHPGWPLLIVLIGLPLLELVSGHYQGPIPYWNFWVLRFLMAAITVQNLAGAYLAANYPWWLVVLAAAGSGHVAGGSGNALGHELGHGRTMIDRRLSKWFYTTICFGHYNFEHGTGHHVLIGTPRDSLFTHANDTLGSFSLRNMVRQFKLAVELGRQRQCLWNEVYGPIVFYVLINAMLYGLVGWKAVLFLTVQTIMAYTVDATITYIQHWALWRKPLDNGRYERVGPQHTWDCTNWITTLVSFNNCRHPDHHINPGKDLNSLESTPASPQVPYGYAVIGTVANVPPLFLKWMTPLIPAGYGPKQPL